MLDAPRLRYHCPYELQFEARLYQDMAIVEGLRGFLPKIGRASCRERV